MPITVVTSKTFSSTVSNDFSIDLSDISYQTNDLLWIFQFSAGALTGVTGVSPDTIANFFGPHAGPDTTGSMLQCFFAYTNSGPSSLTVHSTDFPTSVTVVQTRGRLIGGVIDGDWDEGNGTTPNPPPQTCGPSAQEAFLVFAAGVTDDTAFSMPTTGYTEITRHATADFFVAAAAIKQPIALNATDDPSTFSGWTVPGDWIAITMRIGIGSADQALTPSLFNASDTLFTPRLDLGIFPPLVTSADAFNTPPAVVARQGFLQPATTHSEPDNFFSPVVDLKLKFLLPQLYTAGDDFFTPLVQRVDVFVAEVPAARGASRSIMLIEIDAVDGDGNQSALRYGTEGVMTVPEGLEAAEHFEERVIDPGNFEATVSSTDLAAAPRAEAGFGDIIIAAGLSGHDGASTDPVLNYAVDGRQISIYETDSKRAPRSLWELRLRAIVDHLSSDDAYNRLSFKITDALKLLEEPILTNAFAGTTTGGGTMGVEGNETLAGVKKQKCYGNVFNVEGQAINPYDLVWQFSDSACNSLAVKDAGASLTNAGDAGSVAALFGWVQVAGNYLTYLAGGMARLGSSPVGAVTADVVIGNTFRDRTPSVLSRMIMADRYEFDNGVTVDAELLVASPDTFTLSNVTRTGSGPWRLVESSATNVEHSARTATFSKQPRSIVYRMVGEFDPDPRGIMLRLGNSSSAFAAVIFVEGSDERTVEHGGYAVLDHEVETLTSGYSRITMVVSTNSAASVYGEIVLVTSAFDPVYTGDGTSGAFYRNVSLQATIPVDDDEFDDLDRNNVVDSGILVTGDDTVGEVCQTLVSGIGGFIVQGPDGLLKAARLSYPPVIPESTNEQFITSPDALWGTSGVNVTGNNPLIISEMPTNSAHFISTVLSKQADKVAYRFYGEFLRTSGTPNFSIYITSDNDKSALFCELALGLLIISSNGAGFIPETPDTTTLDSASATLLSDGYLAVRLFFVSDRQSSLRVQLFMLSSTFGVEYTGSSSNKVAVRNLSLMPRDPSVAQITEEIIIGDSLERLATGDRGRGVPYWRTQARYARNWRVQKGTEVIPAVDQATRVRLGQEWLTSIAFEDAAVKANYVTSTELVFETTLADLSAQTEAARRAELYSVPRSAYRCEIPLRYANECRLGEFVTLAASRFDLQAGKNFQVIGRIENFERRTVTLTLWG